MDCVGCTGCHFCMKCYGSMVFDLGIDLRSTVYDYSDEPY
jgi:hypothetical protein